MRWLGKYLSCPIYQILHLHTFYFLHVRCTIMHQSCSWVTMPAISPPGQQLGSCWGWTPLCMYFFIFTMAKRHWTPPRGHSGRRQWHNFKWFNLSLVLCTLLLAMLNMVSVFIVFSMASACWVCLVIFIIKLLYESDVRKNLNDLIYSPDFQFSWVIKIEFLLIISLEYQANKSWE